MPMQMGYFQQHFGPYLQFVSSHLQHLSSVLADPYQTRPTTCTVHVLEGEGICRPCHYVWPGFKCRCFRSNCRHVTCYLPGSSICSHKIGRWLFCYLMTQSDWMENDFMLQRRSVCFGAYQRGGHLPQYSNISALTGI